MSRSFFSRFPEYKISHDEGIHKFLNRVNNSIYSGIESESNYKTYYFSLFCRTLGLDKNNYIRKNYLESSTYSGVEELTNRNLLNTIKVIEKLPSTYYNLISNVIGFSKTEDNIDLGIRFHDGLFYKAGDEELDKLIIDNSIDNISPYEKAKTHYLSALKKYSSGDYSNALTECYTTLEKLAKEILSNDKTLENNRDELIRFLKDGNEDGFVKNWREIIKNLCSYLHDFSTRHGGKIEQIDEIEVDATIYLVGTVINLLAKKDKTPKK